jgi:hypothetical protein
MDEHKEIALEVLKTGNSATHISQQQNAIAAAQVHALLYLADVIRFAGESRD